MKGEGTTQVTNTEGLHFLSLTNPHGNYKIYSVYCCKFDIFGPEKQYLKT